MKKIVSFFLLFTVFVTALKAQDTPPAFGANFYKLTTNTPYYDAITGDYWLFLGNTLGFKRMGGYAKVKSYVDSVAALKANLNGGNNYTGTQRVNGQLIVFGPTGAAYVTNPTDQISYDTDAKNGHMFTYHGNNVLRIAGTGYGADDPFARFYVPLSWIPTGTSKLYPRSYNKLVVQTVIPGFPVAMADTIPINQFPTAAHADSTYSAKEGILGTLYSKAGWTSLGDFTDVGSTGAAIVSNQIAFTSGATDYSKRLQLSAYGSTGLEKYRIKAHFVANEKSSTAYGVGFSQFGRSTFGRLSLTAKFDMTDGGTSGFLSLQGGSMSNQAFVIATSATGLAFAAGDSIEMVLDRNVNTLQLKAKNLTTGSDYVVLNYTYTWGTGAAQPNAGDFCIIPFGGAFTVTELTITSTVVKNPKLMLLGDSKFAAYRVTNEQARISTPLQKAYGSVVMEAGAGDALQEALAKSNELLKIHPEYVMINDGRNNIQQGDSLATIMTMYDAVRQMFINGGSKVIDVLPFAEVSPSTINQSAFVAALKAKYNAADIIDTWTTTQQCVNCLFTDGVHQINAGTESISNTILDANKINGGSKLASYDHLVDATYVSALGKNGGQTVYGGKNAGEGMTLSSNPTATKGKLTIANVTYDEANGWVGIGTTTPAAKLHIVGNATANSWGVNGVGLRINAATYTDATGTGVIASDRVHTIGIPTINTTASGTTITTASTLSIAGDPLAGPNVTGGITNAFGIELLSGHSKLATISSALWNATPITTQYLSLTPGTASFTTNGSTTSFNVTYTSPGFTPTAISWMPQTTIGATGWWITSITSTGFTVNYTTAPASGTATAKYTLIK